MSLVQEMSEVPFPAQVAMQDPWANYRMNVQTCFATDLREAWLLFDGTLLVRSVWQSPPWITRGQPLLVAGK